MDNFPKIQIKSTEELSAWLAKNYQQNQSYWLVTYKKSVPEFYVKWADMVDELLCFGWIDSVSSKVDADRTMRLISQRKPKSAWSGVNKKKIATLTNDNKMQPSGMEAVIRAKENGSWNFLDDVEQGIIPPDLEAMLKTHQNAFEHFTNFPKSTKRTILEWIKTAKKLATRQQRIEQTVEKATQNLRIR